MKRWQLMLSLVGAVAAGALGMHLVEKPGHQLPPPRGDGALTARLEALESAAAEARLHVASLEQQARSRPAEPSGAAPPPGGGTAAPAEEAPKREIKTDGELAQAYDAAFTAEPPDHAWSRSAEPEMRGLVDAQLPRTSRVVSFECRSKFCRLEVVHESIESSNTFLDHLFLPQFGNPMATSTAGYRAAAPTPTADGKLDYVVYVARSGTAVALDDAPPAPANGP